MKNLLIYTGSSKKFSDEDLTLAKIQIDNSFDLGWKREDILLFTDFPFEYNGVKAVVLPDGLYYDFDLKANKVPVIVYLINQGILDKGQLYWCHDFDAYENFRINESELGLEDLELGLTHYTYKPEWQCASFFFRSAAEDIFELIDKTTRTRPYSSRNNEKTLTRLINDGAIDDKRYKRMNVTYNIMKRYLQTIYPMAEKPLKVLHFRPSDPKDNRMPDSALNMFMYGENELKKPLMSDRLIRIFHQHEIK